MRVTLYALVMLFGALVASIGLVLLFRKHEQSLSKIRIFNQEFQFSAPGLVVALAGCILVALFPVLGVQDRDVMTFGSRSEVVVPGQSNTGAREIKMSDGGVFKLINSDVASYSSDNKVLTVTIRYTAIDSSAVIGHDKIRLRVQDRFFAPECAGCNAFVESHSDYDFKAIFYPPASAKTAGLQMGLIGNGVPEIPIDLTVSAH